MLNIFYFIKIFYMRHKYLHQFFVWFHKIRLEQHEATCGVALFRKNYLKKILTSSMFFWKCIFLGGRRVGISVFMFCLAFKHSVRFWSFFCLWYMVCHKVWQNVYFRSHFMLINLCVNINKDSINRIRHG